MRAWKYLVAVALILNLSLYLFNLSMSETVGSRFNQTGIRFTPPDLKTRREAVGFTGNLVKDLRVALEVESAFSPISKPRQGEWLSLHKETGQTYSQYVKASPNWPDAERNVIYLLPLDSFENPSPDSLAACLKAFYGLETKVLDVLPIHALGVTTRINQATHQRQALTTDILEVLQKTLPQDAYCLLAVTVTDLYPAESWNFVFGQASFKERVGVYSFARYQPGFPGSGDLETAKEMLLRRSVKTLLHETAHMFGMKHCIYYKCLVNGSNHLQESDAIPLHFCPVCLRKAFRAKPDLPSVRYSRIEKVFRELGLSESANWLVERLASQ